VFDVLLQSAWLGSALWATVYISDYVLTVTCARLYRAQDNIVFEGSYEITPIFQADIDALRAVSPRCVVALGASTLYVWLVRSIGGPSTDDFGLYAGVLGALACGSLSLNHYRLARRHDAALGGIVKR
jgi:hypothetical protein